MSPPGQGRSLVCPDYGYLQQQYLTHHLEAARVLEEIDALCGDLRFVAIQLRRSGPAAVEADLARSQSSSAGRLRRVIAQNAHLLREVQPATAR